MNSLARHTVSALALTLGSFLSVGAGADPVAFGFEDLTVPFHTAVSIPDGYAGASWSGWALRRTDELQYTGLNTNNASAILALGGEGAAIDFASPVRLDGLFAANPSSKMAYALYLDGLWVGSSGSRVAGSAAFLPSNYAGEIDRIVFSSDATFAIDDLAVAAASTTLAVPEPTSLALLLTGVAALGVTRVARRRARDAARHAPPSSRA